VTQEKISQRSNRGDVGGVDLDGGGLAHTRDPPRHLRARSRPLTYIQALQRPQATTAKGGPTLPVPCGRVSEIATLSFDFVIQHLQLLELR
jgi:hypothetical protein